MCTSPVTITKVYPSIGKRSFTVPCGKCAECVRKKQSSIQALSLLQANKSGMVHFFTFTYSNEKCPVAISEITPDGPCVVGFERGATAWLNDKGIWCNRVDTSTMSEGYCRTPSLHREDLKLVIKRFRRRCERLKKPLDDFKYLATGEYGERHGRPHYHALFYGLTQEQACLLRAEWELAFGFCMVEPAPDRKLDYVDVMCISKYVSKYVSKGVYTRWRALLPYVEPPRRQSSLKFGLTDDATINKLADFIMAATYMEVPFDFPSLDCLMLTSSLLSLIGERVYLLTAKNMLCQKP